MMPERLPADASEPLRRPAAPVRRPEASAHPVGVDALVHLQGAAGNRAVVQLVSQATGGWQKRHNRLDVPLRNTAPADATDLDPSKGMSTFVIRAHNSGDMYHIRAAMIAHPGHALIIWDVSNETRAQAQQIVDLHDDLIANGQVVRYTTDTAKPEGFPLSETKATERVVKHLTNTAGQPGSGGPEEVNRDFADRYGAYSPEEADEFEADLGDRGRFDPGGRYVLVPFRSTGHSDRPGANAPALDTGLTGMEQIVEAVREQLGPSVSVVPMGEEPADWRGANLLNYWTWPSARGRRRQLSLLKYLADSHEVIGAVGMRSGVLDQLAFAGIKVLSIDISPHRREDGAPNIKPSKGWLRGLKMEGAYGSSYGRAFIKEPRAGERDKNDPSWKGEFAPDDNEAISDAVGFYFGRDANPGAARHSSHPFDPQEVEQALATLPPAASMSAFQIVEYLRPYLRELWQNRAQLRAGPKADLKDRLDKAQDRLTTVEAKARDYAGTFFIDADWLSDHRWAAMMETVPSDARDYRIDQIAAFLKVDAAVDQNRIAIVNSYQYSRYLYDLRDA